MRVFTWIVCLFLSCQVSFGQLESMDLSGYTDSVRVNTESLGKNVSARLDSLTDPVGAAIGNLPADTLARIEQRLDSIERKLTSEVDSLTHSYTAALGRIQSSARGYQAKLDSLESLSLPTEKYQEKIDSLSRWITEVEGDLGKKIDAIKAKATGEIKSIEYPPELGEKVSRLTGAIDGLGPETIEAKLPSSLNLGQVGRLQNPTIPDIGANVNKAGIPGIPNLKGIEHQDIIPELNTAMGDLNGVDKLSGVTEQVDGIEGEVGAVAKNLNPEAIDQLAESRVSQLEEVKVLRDQPTDLPLNAGASEAEMKAALKQEAQKVAVDHFAGKEQQLKAAMDRISRYKAKYTSVSSIADVVKRPPNPMAKKSFRERIVPGLGFQIQKKGEDLLFDLNPYIGYRFTGRITAGPGWNQRVAYQPNFGYFDRDARIFGPRVFGEFKLGKGFSPRAEFEVMRTKVPPHFQSPSPDPEGRQWVWGAFLGIKKEYKLFKTVKGTASVMTRLFDPGRKSPYAEVLNMRFGFEFPQKKRPSKKQAVAK